MVFSVFAMLSGCLVFGLISLLSLIEIFRIAFIALTAFLGITACWWHARGRRSFKLDRRSIQASRALASLGWVGMAYFGSILGATLFTEMTTPTVQVLAALSVVAGLKFGIVAGIGLGLARSFDPWRGAFASGRDPATVVKMYISRPRSAGFKVVGIALSIFFLVGDAALAVRMI